jgi:tRNA-binding protein
MQNNINTQHSRSENSEHLENTLSTITFDDFLKVQMCAGTIIQVEDNIKAIKPSYILTIDFGSAGIKTSSAQLTQNYSKENLLGRQIIAVMNFPTKRIAGVKSEVLVLGSVSESHGVVLLQPTMPVPNGSFVR